MAATRSRPSRRSLARVAPSYSASHVWWNDRNFPVLSGTRTSGVPASSPRMTVQPVGTYQLTSNQQVESLICPVLGRYVIVGCREPGGRAEGGRRPARNTHSRAPERVPATLGGQSTEPTSTGVASTAPPSARSNNKAPGGSPAQLVGPFRTQHQGKVWRQHQASPRHAQAGLITNKKCELLVAPIIGGRLVGLSPVDPDRLGHNYGPPVGKVGEDPSTQALMFRPAPRCCHRHAERSRHRVAAGPEPVS